ncbi:unnamed protein product, partial [Ilex paraguariensis]
MDVSVVRIIFGDAVIFQTNAALKQPASNNPISKPVASQLHALAKKKKHQGIARRTTNNHKQASNIPVTPEHPVEEEQISAFTVHMNSHVNSEMCSSQICCENQQQSSLEKKMTKRRTNAALKQPASNNPISNPVASQLHALAKKKKHQGIARRTTNNHKQASNIPVTPEHPVEEEQISAFTVHMNSHVNSEMCSSQICCENQQQSSLEKKMVKKSAKKYIFAT